MHKCIGALLLVAAVGCDDTTSSNPDAGTTTTADSGTTSTTDAGTTTAD